MKILILSGEVWQDGTNGGNVLTNMFLGFDAEFAQVYCNPGTPQNNICDKYFQITDGMVLHSFFKHKPVGNSFILSKTKDDNKNEGNIEQKNKKFDKFFHKFNCNFFHFVRNCLWNLSNWKNDKLKKFIDDFNPDIIFAPCYGNKFLLRLTRFVKDRTGKKVISYISDDSYTLRQFNLSPFYWINRFSVRKQLRKTFSYYSLCYTMTELQKEQCEKDFHANMKILLKPVEPCGEIKTTVNNPIKIIYAGGIYLNRYKTLFRLSDAIKKINKDDIKIVLDIYTGNNISKKINKKLNDGVNTFIHNKVSSEELQEKYLESDIALHVESFDLKNRLAVRMSFSTKITDCLSSGCAVMAICDKKQGGFRYLQNNDLAFCIDSPSKIYENLIKIVNNKNLILTYSSTAKDYVVKWLNPSKIREGIRKDFYSVLENESSSN